MDYVKLGSTGLKTNKNGFGALPIQRISDDEAACLLQKAYQSGITLFDTARDYTDSERKIGLALSSVRDKIIIATKTSAKDTTTFWQNLETSLEMLQTDYIDIYQLHNPPFCPKPGDESGLYDALLEAKAQGKIRHIGLTNHKIGIAYEAAESGLYETIQYPVSYLSSEKELEFIRFCDDKNIGVLGMKALSGGLLTDAAAAYAFLLQFPAVVPIWGIQLERELDEFLALQEITPALDDSVMAIIKKDKEELGGEFCRGCGYCMPCPQEIGIPMAARMTLLITRSPAAFYLGAISRDSMKHAKDCTHCGHCVAHCPYGLDVPRLIAEGWEAFQKVT